MTSISLKNTVMDLGKAYEKPMEMKAPTTTAQPQPPSGGVYPTGPPTFGGMSAQEAGGRWTAAAGAQTAQLEPGLKEGPVERRRACKIQNRKWINFNLSEFLTFYLILPSTGN